MPMIRLQNNTPSEYSNQSRDFQLFCRLYDTVINGLQFDISTIVDILNTKKARDTILPLLQTKLGFFTNKQIDNDSLRYFLQAFPSLIKNKGSAQAIRQAVITFLKVNNIKSAVTVYYTVDNFELKNGYIIPDHSILIGLDTSFRDTTILDEIFKYILPAGIGYYFYFYNDIKIEEKLKTSNNATLLFTSLNINSQLRGSSPSYSNDFENRVTGAVDTLLLASNDTEIPVKVKSVDIPIGGSKIINFNNTYSESIISDLSIKIDPVQDLNGYDAPWPAGGGKNKLEPRTLTALMSLNPDCTWNGNVATVNGLTVECAIKDGALTGEYKVNGTATANTSFYLTRMDATPYAGMILNGIPSGTVSQWEMYYALQTSPYTAWGYDLGSGVTLSESASDVSVLVLRLKDGQTFSNSVIKPMIRPASESDATYAPYSNICPIIGWTGANITATGANIYDQQWEAGTISPTTGDLQDTTAGIVRCKNRIPVLPSTAYRAAFTLAATNVLAIHAYTADDNWIGMYDPATDEWRTAGGGIGYISQHPVFTTPTNAAYIRFRIGGAGGSYTAGSLSINYPSTVEDNIAFGNVYTVNWQNEVFAGTATYMGGGKWSIQATHVALPSLSTLGWSYTSNGGFFNVGVGWLHLDGSKRDTLICNKYKTLTPASTVLDDNCIGLTLGGDSLRIRDSRYTDPSEFKATLSDAVCYAPLLEAYYPAPIIVDGPDPALRLGDNNIWADCGNIISLSYKSNESLYLGQFEDDITFEEFASILSNVIDGNIILYRNKSLTNSQYVEYIYMNNAWQSLAFTGTVSSLPSSGELGDIVYLKSDNVSDTGYYIYMNNSWAKNNYALYVYLHYILNVDGE